MTTTKLDTYGVLKKAREDLAAGRRKEASQGLDYVMRDVRRLVETVEPASLDRTLDQETLKKLSQWCEAVALVAEKLERWPEAIEFDRRQAELARAVKSGPFDGSYNPMDGHLALTRHYLAAGRSDEARTAWEELLRLGAFSSQAATATFPRAVADLGAKVAAQGRPTEADAVLAPGLAERRKRLAEQPADETVRNELRRAYRTLGIVDEYSQCYSAAVQAFDQELGLRLNQKSNGPPLFHDNPLLDKTLMDRAVCLDALGRIDEADRAFKDVQASNWLGQSLRGVFPIELADDRQPQRDAKRPEELPGARSLVDADGPSAGVLRRPETRGAGQEQECARPAPPARRLQKAAGRTEIECGEELTVTGWRNWHNRQLTVQISGHPSRDYNASMPRSATERWGP
jgi:tetratricopeptide (TPR) repeat protein